jgi:DNA-binding PadR family transcriptional regulator
MLSLWQVLDAVAELEDASLELVCWELSVATEEARPAFEQARDDGLIARSGVDDTTSEVLYALTPAGRRALRERLAG